MNKYILFLSTLLATSVSSEISIDSGKLSNNITGTRRRLSKTGKGGKSGGEDTEDGSWWSGSDDGWHHPSGDSELKKLLHGRFSGKDDASGAQERVGDPEGPVTTDTRSQIRWGFDEGFTKMGYEIKILLGEKVTLIHFHCGQAGSNGPVVVDFWETPPDTDGTDINGVARDGYLTNDDILSDNLDGGMCGNIKLNNIASLYQAMLNGDIYLNIHTQANPAGENRGQIFVMH